eukprot:364523-Chlamydomonas_euryale.AAC.12
MSRHAAAAQANHHGGTGRTRSVAVRRVGAIGRAQRLRMVTRLGNRVSHADTAFAAAAAATDVLAARAAPVRPRLEPSENARAPSCLPPQNARAAAAAARPPRLLSYPPSCGPRFVHRRASDCAARVAAGAETSADQN